MTRAQCRAVVMKRAGHACERCGRWVSDDVPEWSARRAHVNEKVPRSRGGSATDPTNCELLCQGCHMPGGQHAPTAARMKTLQRKREEGL